MRRGSKAGLTIRGEREGSEVPHHCFREQAVEVGKVSLGGRSGLDRKPPGGAEDLVATSHCHPCKDGFIKLFLNSTCRRDVYLSSDAEEKVLFLE